MQYLLHFVLNDWLFADTFNGIVLSSFWVFYEEHFAKLTLA